jgi:DEAD/DEAH box helicase domain-containing protein
MAVAGARLESCECEHGCLACVHLAGCGEYNEGLDKGGARDVLRWLLEGILPPLRNPRG